MGDERSGDSEFGEAAVAVAEQSPNGRADHAAPSTDAEATASATSDPATSSTDAPAAGKTDGDASGDTPDFLTQLALAMQATAGAERGRAVQDIDRRASSHIADIRARAEAEALKMRDLAGDDRRAIERWAETEQQRIKAERDRRTKELEADLTQSLAEHGRQIDVQIQAVEAVVAKHRTDVEAFFTALDSESDPVRFAQRAGQRPAFPDLDRLGAPITAASETTATPTTASASATPDVAPAGAAPQAGASATAEAEPVGVMDPVARLGLVESSPEPSPVAKPAEAATASPASSGPIAWLRRNADEDR